MLIPLEYYSTFYYNVMLVFVLIVAVQSGMSSLESGNNLRVKNGFGLFILFFIVIYMGTRPLSFRFGDMMLYAEDYASYAKGFATPRDPLFDLFSMICSRILPVSAYFFLCAFFYVYPLYRFSKKVFGDYWFYSFFMLVISFSFWTYGVNGIRNGIATSLFLFAISRDKRLSMLLWMLAAILTHKSMLLPTAAYLACIYFNNKPKTYFIFWALCIPLSLILGRALEGFLLTSGIVEENKLAGYFSSDTDLLDMPDVVKSGFRWDFILYSATGVFAGWYFIFKRKLQDVFYDRLFNTFLFTNGFWILVIRANFSNRFAYLSWFMLAVVIIYPLLKNQAFKNQHQVIGMLVAAYFVFTYFLNVVLSQS